VNPRTSLSAPRSTGLSALVDDTLGSERLVATAHGEDWPDPGAAGPLPPEVWSGALGNVARDILARPSRQFRTRLCELSWRLCDGRGNPAAVLGAAVEIIHAGSLIIDDIEDGSPVRRGGPALHLEHGVGRALNAGNWMYFWALRLVGACELAPAGRDRVLREVVEAMHDCHLGQALDLSIAIARVPQAAVYRTVATSTILKTGALMGLAARLGAMAAGATAARETALARFGRRLGLGLQMLDDFGNLTGGSDGNAAKALEDLRNGRPTWPWALAARALSPATYAVLQSRARPLARKDVDPSDDARARALAAELRMAVGLAGRREATAYLESALADLAREVGPREELALVASEIHRLEESYG
jgi:geranylgeranyl pyrophosphate synthase